MTDFGNTHLGADDYRPLDWGRKDRTGGAAVDPSTLDYLEATGNAAGTFTNNTFHTMAWTVVGGSTSGTDISIVSGVPTINADGVYAINAGFGAIADANSDTFDQYRGILAINRAGGRDSFGWGDVKAPAVEPGPKHGAHSQLCAVVFLPAGSTIDVKMKMAGGGAGTWSFNGGDLVIDRII